MKSIFKITVVLVAVSLCIPKISQAECVDVDGDGYGWNNSRPCRTRPVRSLSREPEALRVGSIRISNVTSNSARIATNFTSAANGKILFGKTQHFGKVGPYLMTKSKLFSQFLNGLEPNTTYYFKVEARNGNQRAYSPIKTFKTSGVVTPTTINTSTTIPPTQTPTLKFLGVTKLTREANFAEVHFSTSDISQAHIEYGENKIDTKESRRATIFKWKDHIQDLKNLKAQTQYFYRIHYSGKENINQNLTTQWFSFTTPRKTPSTVGRIVNPMIDSLAPTIGGISNKPNFGTAKFGDWGHPYPPSKNKEWLKIEVKKGTQVGGGWKNELLPNSTEGWVAFNMRLVNWKSDAAASKLPGISGPVTEGSGAIARKPNFSELYPKVIGGQGGGGAGGTTGGPDGKGKSWSARMMVVAANKVPERLGTLGFYTYHKDSSNINQQGRQFGQNFTWEHNGVDTREILDEKWHKIKIYVKLNDIGKSNGVLKAYFDGKLAYQRDNFSFTENPKYRGIYFFLNVYHGGNPVSPNTYTYYLDDLRFNPGSIDYTDSE